MTARRTVCAGAFAVVLMAVCAWPLHAQDRLIRTFGPENGLTAPPVWAVAQDSIGFLWIGTQGGLFRFDGSEFRRWAADSIRSPVGHVTVSPEGRVAALEIGGRAFEVTADGARGIAPDVARSNGQNALAYDSRGVLWFLHGSRLERRLSDGSWRALPADWFDGERIHSLVPNHAGAIDVLTYQSVWRLSPDARPYVLLRDVDPWDALSTPDGRTIVLTDDAVVVLSSRGEVVRSWSIPKAGRRLAVAERGGTIWVSLDNSLLAFRPGEAVDVRRYGGAVTYGGPLLVDREGSLWLASNALHQFPEPETRIVTALDGHELSSARFLERSGATLWVGRWNTLLAVERDTSGWSLAQALPTLAHLCADSNGSIWSSTTRPSPAILELRGSTVRAHESDVRSTMFHCTADRNGGVWMGFGRGIVHVGEQARTIRPIPSSPPASGDTLMRALLHDSGDRLWASADPDRICSAPAALLRAGAADVWTCDSLPGIHAVTGMVELPGGTLWAATHSGGLIAYDAEGWRPLSMDGLPTRTVFGLTASPRGGVWMAGHGFLRRIEEGPDGRPVTLERVSRWHGFPGPGAGDVLEDADGTLWIAYDGGLVRVPSGVRSDSYPPPRVALVEATIDGAPLPEGTPLTLPHDRNRLELRFAALSFRDPSQLRHQVRLGPDEPWSDSRGSPSFRWVDLRPGDYEVQYRASLDGITWSAEPVRFAFTVMSPWYATPWAIALAILLLAAIAWVGHRARVAHLVALERQRTRIAMDLHDEVGSGLASVGILSGVLATDGLTADARRRAAVDIATAAEDLGHALSDIVWSLDPHAATMEELASRLTEHGERLTADAELELHTRFPVRWPAELIDVAVRRNVLLIGLEALHNAVRHAHASEIRLRLLPQGRDWQLSVQDDGTGFDASVGYGAGRGHGLRSMRRRAEEIGARLTVSSAPGSGTTITLRFAPRSQRANAVARFADRLRSLLPHGG